ncbi:Ribonuclease H-like domain [Phytophthora cactorum]|nr:Ribonuclease H-like domain [Phytophthora cactorum]
MVHTSSQICSMLFTDAGNDFYNCTTFGKQYKRASATRICRTTYGATTRTTSKKPKRMHAAQRTRDLYRWLEWVICDRLPFAFVERRLTRLNAELSTVSEDTLLRYLILLFEVVESRVASKLPESFGLVLDGWTSSNRRYVAIVAVVDSATGNTGTAGSNLSAQSQYDLIADTSSRYNKPWSAVEFVVGDNCSDYVKKEDELITKVQFLMPKLRTIKGQAILRRGSHLSPLLRNDTRWPSTYEMVERYVKHQLLIIQLGYDLLVEHDRVKALLQDLTAFLQRGETLNAAEKSTCAGFRSPDLEWSSSRATEECSIVRAAFKKRKVVERSHFVGVAYVLATSNKCERFFSLAKLVISDLRKRMAPARLEMVMCLHYNRDLWDLSAVDEVRSRLGRNNANN